MGQVMATTTPTAVDPLSQCAKCGACTAVCPVYKVSGNEAYSARGKRHLKEVYGDDTPSPVVEDIFSKCLLCGACASVCPRHLDITDDVQQARQDFSAFYGEHGYQKFLARQALNRPYLLGAARVLGKQAARLLFDRLPIDSGLRLRLAMFAEDQPEGADKNVTLPRPARSTDATQIYYFPGCAATYLYPEISRSVVELLDTYGYRLTVPDGLACCGLAMGASGDKDAARRAARQNIRILEAGEGPILVSCGSCYAQLIEMADQFAEDDPWRLRATLVAERFVEISRFVEEIQRESETTPDKTLEGQTIFYHDPCHMRFAVSVTDEPRTLLRNAGATLLELPGGPQCCGQGGLFHVGAPELAASIRDDLMEKIVALNPDIITTNCSGCIMQLKMAAAASRSNIPVVHLATLLKTADQGA
jgi:glycolate oxidase iron-sulfur subunit